jgi:hypothetical protein
MSNHIPNRAPENAHPSTRDIASLYQNETPVPGFKCQMVFIAEQLLSGAASSTDKTYTSNFYNNMAPVFANTGFALMPFQYDPFNTFARSSSVGLDALFTRALNGEEMTEADFLDLKCGACKLAAWALGVSIVAAGGAALSALTTGSAIVVGLASFGGVSVAGALVFAQTLGRAIAGGVSAVVQAICGWTGLCTA